MDLSILLLGTQITVGGAQNVLLSQAQWFREKGYSVTAAFFYDKDNMCAEWDSKYAFPVIDLGAWHPHKSRVTNLLLLVVGLFRLVILLRTNKIDVIETFTPDSNILGLLAARLAGTPVRIASHHGYIEGAKSWSGRLHGWMVNRGFAHRLVVVSDQVRRIAISEEKINTEKVVVILNGITPVRIRDSKEDVRSRVSRNLNLNADDLLVLTVGRLTIQKGHTYLLDAIPNILEHCPKAKFLIAGDGHLRSALEEKVANLGIGNSTYILGTRADIPDLLYSADVFILLWEGLPLALLEAMSTGLPIVATQVEGVKSIIANNVNGFIIPSKDAGAISEALIKILGDSKARKRFGDHNKMLVENEYTIDRMCERYEELFQQEFSKNTKQRRVTVH